jgi:predicted MFS family arabinose efflux permease
MVDRFGPELIWILSLIGQIVALIWHLNIDDINSVSVYLARFLFASSLAGYFGAWLSFTSLQAPRDRIAEVIGVIGSSGFLGMAIGPSIGDAIFMRGGNATESVRLLFTAAGLMIACGLAVAITACAVGRRNGHSNQFGSMTLDPSLTKRKESGAFGTLFRYNPGFLLFVGALMGMTIGFPANFLRPWAKSLEIEQIKVYFITYNLVAFSSRLAFRRAPQRLGLKPTITLAWAFMAMSMLLYLPVRNENTLWIPAAAAGLAHSFMFPSVIAACSLSFPVQHRGLATNLILAMYDTGVVVGMPFIGFVVTTSPELGLDPYPTTFLLLFVLIGLTALMFLLLGFRHKIEGEPASAPEVHE